MQRAKVFNTLYALGVILLPLAIVTGSVEFMSLCTVVAGMSYALRDYTIGRRESLNVMTCYAAFSSLWFGLGNFVGYVVDPDENPRFHMYDVPEYYYEAQILASLGAVVPLVVYDIISRRKKKGQHTGTLATIGFETSDATILRFCIGLLVLGWAGRFLGVIFAALGMVGSLLAMGPSMAVFVLSSRLRSDEKTDLPWWATWLTIVAMATDAGFSLLFSAMRIYIIWPIAAFVLPLFFRRRLGAVQIAVGMVLFAAFLFVFKTVGEVRGRVVGTDRLTYILDRANGGAPPLVGPDDESVADEFGLTSLCARLSTFNQLTQVVRIVHDEGYYDGETLSYAFYVFVPRIIWPDKPEIAPGQWFAKKLGRGSNLTDTRYSNAINMTIPGELYLNFGWLATILGLGLMAVVYYYMWESSAFHTLQANPLGQGFAFILIGSAMFNGSHFAAVINLLLWYIMFVAMTWVASATVQRRRRKTAPRPGSIAAPDARAMLP